MYSLHLTCAANQVDTLTAELWEAGTAGIREIDRPDGSVELISGFETNTARLALLETFTAYRPHWRAEDATDWVLETQRAWPARAIGEKLLLAAPWCTEPTPPGRIRIAHNPGLACGTGEHPCTRLALQALERTLPPGSRIADIGTGSGILAIAALKLGARFAAAVDADEAALHAASENFGLNQLTPALMSGSADALASSSFDLVVANINAIVLLALSDDLLRIACPGATLVLTGFEEHEALTVAQRLPPAVTLREEGWICLISRAL